jgi:hypothetical protein
MNVQLNTNKMKMMPHPSSLCFAILFKKKFVFIMHEEISNPRLASERYFYFLSTPFLSSDISQGNY